MMLADTTERVRELQLLHVTRDMHVSDFLECPAVIDISKIHSLLVSRHKRRSISG
jgi:hypothetical protein